MAFTPTYQFTPNASKGNAFAWANPLEPSIFTGRAFEANVNGESASQVATRSVQRFELRHGRSMGVIAGISAKADQLLRDETYTSRSRGKTRVE